MKRKNSEKGFTLIELLLVVVIIGLMLAVIVPRAWRANIDAKYGLVRQNASELASFGQEWAENQLLAQNESLSTATMDNYLWSLCKPGAGVGVYGTNQTWVADQTNNTNWSISGAGGTAANQPGGILIGGRYITQADATAGIGVAPETTVEGIIPPEKVIRNPFNEVNVFQASNDPLSTGGAVTGAIASATIADVGPGGAGTDDWHYYAFLFQGTDVTTSAIGNDTSYYAGMGPTTLAGMRNGIFFARVRPGL
ncbi:type II secretion system protein [Desulfobacula sp.]|uniref:type II secretion system protein n=1 Tax=Desulfobacula sp. TaxID=2593537 RepID=UPI00260F4E1E|nr:type II secretion system protein [Desulfobacula sp.]